MINYILFAIKSTGDSMKYEEYEKFLKKIAETPYGRLKIAGYSREKDAVYALTISDFSVPDDEKFNILIAGLHVGGEFAAFSAAVETIKFLMRKSSLKYLKKFAVTLMPAVNPYGCFRKNIAQYHNNSAGFDPYVGKWGKSFNYPDLTPADAENEPELAAFLKVVDEIKPEILLDWHGANGRPGETMRETLGASLSNHFIMPWATRMLAAMRKEINKGSSAVFDLEEYLERIPAPAEYRQMFPNQVRPSNAVFYPDMYAYFKYHTLPVVMEIGQKETGWRALKGLMDYALKLPPEYRGSLPVDHIGTDFGNLVVASYGHNPGMRRRSRVELWSNANKFMTFYATPMYLGELGAGLVLGNAGVRRMAGDIQLREMAEHHISEFPVEKLPYHKNIEKYCKKCKAEMFLPLLANSAYSECPGDIENFQNGVTLQLFIPVGHRKNVHMTKVLLNGMELEESAIYGYELVRGSDGWHLFINLPPEFTVGENMYHILADYDLKIL